MLPVCHVNPILPDLQLPNQNRADLEQRNKSQQNIVSDLTVNPLQRGHRCHYVQLCCAQIHIQQQNGKTLDTMTK